MIEERPLRLGSGGASPPDLFPDGRNRLILGDCLRVARELPKRSLALVYLDPPFGTGCPQPFRFGLAARERPMRDLGDPEAWWTFWEPRIRASMGLLRAGGILVLHMDPRLAPRARVGLDAVLGPDRFLNEIVWHYRSGGVARDRFPAKHDTLLVYRNGPGHLFHPLTEKRYLAHRAVRPGVEEHRDERGWYRFARIDDVWEIPFLPADSRERLGYPTQKPEALADRLLLAFTNEGDAVADLTCGSGTFPAAAQRLERRWIGSDLDARALACAAGRLARHLCPELMGRWNGCGVAARRADLARRLARLRRNRGSWGLSREEIRILACADTCGATGLRIESWEIAGARAARSGERNARAPLGRKGQRGQGWGLAPPSRSRG